MKSVYIIVSQNGSIPYNMFTGKGKVYADEEKAEKVLKRKNEWSQVKWYGKYELLELEVEE